MDAPQHQPRTRQQEFHFVPRDRGEQLDLLREAVLPDVRGKDGCLVKASVLKAVLVRIDLYAATNGECYASQQTLANVTGYSPRTIKRAVAALIQLSLITDDRYRTKHHRIVWNELGLLVPPEKLPRRSLAMLDDSQTSAVVTKSARATSAVVTTKSAVVTMTSAVVTPKPSRNTRETKPPSPSPNATADALWQAEKDFALCGIDRTDLLVAIAQRRGLSPEKCAALVAHYREHAAAKGWKPGVLYRRIECAFPDDDNAARWMPASDTAIRLQRMQASPVHAQQRAERQRQAAADQAEQAKLEALYGVWLDTRPRERVLELVRSACPFLLPSVNTKGLSAIAREAVLSYLAQHPREAEAPD